MQTLDLFQTMSRYNSWMNANLYAVCAGMSDEERKRDLRAVFVSVHGTFNHLLLADRVWMGRFTQQPVTYPSLATELYGDFDELWRERQETDRAIAAWLDVLQPSVLELPLTFTAMSGGAARTFPLWVLVQHLFNHQTHHRGQLTGLIEQLGYDCGVTDLLRMPGL